MTLLLSEVEVSSHRCSQGNANQDRSRAGTIQSRCATASRIAGVSADELTGVSGEVSRGSARIAHLTRHPIPDLSGIHAVIKTRNHIHRSGSRKFGSLKGDVETGLASTL